ncbi:MAG TPA: Ig-like domain-containing protein, partial [Pyrinomonadaceae bacterium]|nr:Ig-like domain-containing protein [Pyrinomonadaceae bacterium]
MLVFKRLTLVTVSVLVFQVAAHAQQPGAVATVEVTASQKEAEVGQTVKLTVVAKDAAGNVVKESPSTYFAGPFDAAVADDNGMVKLVGPGEVIAGAQFMNRKAGFTTIRVRPVGVKSIDVSSIKDPLIVGSVIQLEATTRTPSGDPRKGVPITWSSDNAAIATVNSAGVVTAVAPGKATIRATSGEVKTTTTVTVARNTLKSIAVEPGSTTARTGDVVRLKATGTPNGAFTPRWTVSGTGATVYPDGAFVAEQPGTYVVTATAGSVSATSSIVVSPRNAERQLQIVGRAMFKDVQGAEVWLIGNYAYYSTIADHFVVYDVSDPAHPKLTDTIKVDARIINDISTTADGKILVISREGASSRKNGIAFYDTSDPAHPKLISEYTTTVTGGVHSAFVDGHYVYLTDDATGSMRVIDFRDAKNPKEVARWQTEPQHATFIRTKEGETTAGRYLHDLQVKDGLAYLAY